MTLGGELPSGAAPSAPLDPCGQPKPGMLRTDYTIGKPSFLNTTKSPWITNVIYTDNAENIGLSSALRKCAPQLYTISQTSA
jgi:hypothetical protein